MLCEPELAQLQHSCLLPGIEEPGQVLGIGCWVAKKDTGPLLGSLLSVFHPSSHTCDTGQALELSPWSQVTCCTAACVPAHLCLQALLRQGLWYQESKSWTDPATLTLPVCKVRNLLSLSSSDPHEKPGGSRDWHFMLTLGYV